MVNEAEVFMKTGSHLLFCILIAGTFSCAKNHEIMLTDEIIVSNDLIGKWEVILYTDSGIDKTAQLSALNLQFNSTGELLIFNHDSVVNGSWIIDPQIGLDLLKVTVSDAQLPYTRFQAWWYAYDKTTSTISLSNSLPSKSQVIELKRI